MSCLYSSDRLYVFFFFFFIRNTAVKIRLATDQFNFQQVEQPTLLALWDSADEKHAAVWESLIKAHYFLDTRPIKSLFHRCRYRIGLFYYHCPAQLIENNVAMTDLVTCRYYTGRPCIIRIMPFGHVQEHIQKTYNISDRI